MTILAADDVWSGGHPAEVVGPLVVSSPAAEQVEEFAFSCLTFRLIVSGRPSPEPVWRSPVHRVGDEMFNEDRVALWASVFAVSICLCGVALVPILLR